MTMKLASVVAIPNALPSSRCGQVAARRSRSFAYLTIRLWRAKMYIAAAANTPVPASTRAALGVTDMNTSMMNSMMTSAANAPST